MILYNDTDKERTLCDYIPLPSLKGLSIDELQELNCNLYNILETAYIYHSDLLITAIYQDIHKTEIYTKMAKKKQERKGK